MWVPICDLRMMLSTANSLCFTQRRSQLDFFFLVANYYEASSNNHTQLHIYSASHHPLLVKPGKETLTTAVSRITIEDTETFYDGVCWIEICSCFSRLCFWGSKTYLHSVHWDTVPSFEPNSNTSVLFYRLERKFLYYF